MTPGQVACEAWTENHFAHHHCKITRWADLSPQDRADWEAAAKAVLTVYGVAPPWTGD